MEFMGLRYTCKEIAALEKERLKRDIQRIRNLSGARAPKLVIVNTWETDASLAYCKGKIRDCKEVGIEVEYKAFGLEATINDVYSYLYELRHNFVAKGLIDGVILQQPFNPSFTKYETNTLKNLIGPYEDVDGALPRSFHTPATVRGIYDYFRWNEVNLHGANAVIIGRSELVGKPLAKLLTDKDATVTLCHSKTDWAYLEHCVSLADIVVCATGSELFTDREVYANFKDDVVVVDVGIRRTEDGLCGDIRCTNEEATSHATITPVPGGVGLLTRVGLLKNVVDSWEGGLNVEEA